MQRMEIQTGTIDQIQGDATFCLGNVTPLKVPYLGHYLGAKWYFRGCLSLPRLIDDLEPCAFPFPIQGGNRINLLLALR